MMAKERKRERQKKNTDGKTRVAVKTIKREKKNIEK